MLTPGREEDYIPFLDVRNTPITPLTSPSFTISTNEAAQATDHIRTLVRTDRAHHDRGQRAFVSWVQSYAKHHATSIFRIPTLDWSDLASAWGLLRLPRMPELKSWPGDRTLGLSIDWDSYRYADKAREKARVESLADEREGKNDVVREERKAKRRRNVAWSGKEEREGERVERREKRARRREKVREGRMTEEERAREMEVGELLKEIRRRNQAIAVAAEDEFRGFDD